MFLNNTYFLRSEIRVISFGDIYKVMRIKGGKATKINPDVVFM